MPTKLLPGDPAPWFSARASNNPKFAFSAAAGRYIVLTFVRSGVAPQDKSTIAEINKGSRVFDDVHSGWFIVTADVGDEGTGSLPLRFPGIRAFFDGNNAIRGLFGIDAWGNGPVSMVLSPRLQILSVIADEDPATHAKHLLDYVRSAIPLSALSEVYGPAPIMIIPNIFEPEFCRMLIADYEKQGGGQSGFMVEENGKTVGKFDSKHKVRKDWLIQDDKIKQDIQSRIMRRIVPEIRKGYNFNVTRMERYIVSCYEADDGGHFSAHRDNTTKGTAHRRFACSINLNAEDFEGGNLRFPEFGPQVYRPPTGGCVIFGCSLLHEATTVTKGKRYAFLPFFYDEAAAEIRKQNMDFVEIPQGQGAPPPPATQDTAAVAAS